MQVFFTSHTRHHSYILKIYKLFLRKYSHSLIFSFLGENVHNGDHSETQNLSTFSQSSKEVILTQ